MRLINEIFSLRGILKEVARVGELQNQATYETILYLVDKHESDKKEN